MASKKKEEYVAPKSVEELIQRARVLDDDDSSKEVVAIPTSISSFDTSTGVGGVPRGRVSVFKGAEHSGKTLLLLTLIAQAQRMGERCAFIDAEHALTPNFARMLGVDWEALEPFVRRPKTLDAAYDLLIEFARSGMFAIVGFDSLAGLTTREALETRAGDSASRAASARMNSDELKKLTALQHPNTAVVLINQIRINPNPPAWMSGPQEYSPGGKAVGHASSMTVETKLGQIYMDGDRRIGQRIKTYITKNKVATPFTRSEFDLMYGTGLDLTTDMIDTALTLDVIQQSGSWFYVRIIDDEEVELDMKKFAGRKSLEDAIRADDFLRGYIEERVAAARP